MSGILALTIALWCQSSTASAAAGKPKPTPTKAALGNQATPKPNVPRPAAVPPAGAKATEARLNGNLEQAIALYRQALKTQPTWAEGWYFLASLHYERDEAKECVPAMTRFISLAPEVSKGAAILGLCRFQLGDYAGALSSLIRAERLGLPRGDNLTDVASYHAAILFTKDENFERALKVLNFFANREPLDPKIIEAVGIASLRRPIFPSELPLEDREVVYRVGRAILTASNRRTAEAERLFAAIVSDFPNTPNLHFAYGGLLIAIDPEKGIPVLKREIEIQPNHLPARILLGIEYLNRGEPELALPLGEQAVLLAPSNFTSHVVLGRALAEGGTNVSRGIEELEKAIKLEPTSPQVRIALAKAYTKAGRLADAATQRAEFQRLKKLIEEQQP